MALKTHTETPDGQQIDQQPEPRPSAWLRLRWFGERYMLAHLSAYPVGVVSAMASIPLALMVRGEEVKRASATGAHSELLRRVAQDMQLDPLAAAQMEIVMQFVLLCALLTLVVPHLTALPWAWAASTRPSVTRSDPRLAQRLRWFIVSMLVLAALWALVGAIGWIWLMTL
ncbi:MAG: hypothetical protein R3B89_11470 [Polyangiaceae bacterium]